MEHMEIRRKIRKISIEELEGLVNRFDYHVVPGSTVTVCYMELNCGVVLTGTSGCLNPDDFDAELGRKIARENVFNQLWQLEGYARLRVFVDGLQAEELSA